MGMTLRALAVASWEPLVDSAYLSSSRRVMFLAFSARSLRRVERADICITPNDWLFSAYPAGHGAGNGGIRSGSAGAQFRAKPRARWVLSLGVADLAFHMVGIAQPG